jgi:uncharacterized protein (DUF488 family)
MDYGFDSAARVYTIGHSNRSYAEFLELLKEYDIKTLVDIRSLPGSRKFPHFDQKNLQETLPVEGIQYVWMKELGGLRHSSKDFVSPNSGLTNAAFRAYADYMMSEEFHMAIEKLLSLAVSSTTAYMCAEAVYWRCHRRLVSDYLVANGQEVLHIMGKTELTPHRMTDGAVLTSNGLVLYPGNASD